MTTNETRAAKLSAKALGCAPAEVRARPYDLPWARVVRGFLAHGPAGSTQHPSGLVVILPGRARTPPLVLASQPVWDQILPASALLKAEEIDPDAVLPATLAEICRLALGGPGARIANPELARRELRDRASYDAYAAFCPEVELAQHGTQWRLRFCAIAPDAAIEAWEVGGFGRNVSRAECSVWYPPGTWPIAAPSQRRG